MRRIRLTLKFLLAVILGALRGRPVEIPHVHRGAPSAMLTPDGRYMPVMAGGDETPEEKEAREEAEREKADEEAAGAEAEAKRAEKERIAAEEKDGKWKGEFDQERAERAVENARTAEKKAKAEAEKAKTEAAELRQAQESEQETTKRERDEFKAQAERERSAREHTLIDLAIRDAAADAEVPAKKVRRLVKLIDREEISVDEEGEVSGAEEAVGDFLDEFPEFKAPEKPEEEPEEEEPTEEPGGKPDRKRKPKELTAKQVQEMAKSDPEKFNRLFDEGKIPKSALEGLKP